jgi:hypothetical protein
LRRVAGIEAIGQSVVGPAEPGLFGTRRRRVTRTVVESGPIVHSEEVRSLSDVPEHLRSRVEQLLAEGREGTHLLEEAVRVTVRDSEGNERTYSSLEEMPEELRADYERSLRRARKRRR